MSQWYYEKNLQRIGPVPEAELQRMADAGTLHPSDLVWMDGMLDWAEAGSIPDMFFDRPRPFDDEDRLLRPRSYGGDEPFPRRRARPEPNSRQTQLVWIVGAIGIMVLIGLVVFLIMGQNSNQGTIPLTQPGSWEGSLSPFDRHDPQQTDHACKVYTFPMEEAKTYVIDMQSTTIDSFLRLEDPAGTELIINDDGGGPGLQDARIIFKPKQPGLFRIIATTCDDRHDNQYGKYKLSIKIR